MCVFEELLGCQLDRSGVNEEEQQEMKSWVTGGFGFYSECDRKPLQGLSRGMK